MKQPAKKKHEIPVVILWEEKFQPPVVSRTLVEPKIYFDELIEGPHY